MSDVIRGKVVRETPDGMVLIEAPIVSRELQTRRRVREYWVQPIDSRTLSDKQRRTCYGLMGSIAEWMGEYPDSA